MQQVRAPFKIVYGGLNELHTDKGELKPTPIYIAHPLCMICDRPIAKSRYKHFKNEFCSRECNREYRTSCGYRTEVDEVVEVADEVEDAPAAPAGPAANPLDAHCNEAVSESEVQPKKKQPKKKRQPKKK